MESSFPIAHRHVLSYEGGYCNHPADPGGVTLDGVTQVRYDEYRRSKGLPTRRLTPQMSGTHAWTAERDDIYRSGYWLPPKCGQLPAGVDAAIYDYSVNSGIGRSRKVLQRLVGVPNDGVIGPLTLAAVGKRDPKQLVNAICDERLAFLQRLRTWPTFGRGWGARVTDVRSYATALAAGAALERPTTMSQPQAKGEVPEPKAAKTAVKTGAPAGGAAAGGSFWDWVAAHQIETALIAVAVIGVMALAIHGLNEWRRRQQESPTPSIGVVPEAA